MVRLACVDVPVLPLQLLLRRHPEWESLPVAVVDRDAPQGTILWVNQRAWKCRIRPGLRYAEGLSIDPTLRAGEVGRQAIVEGVDVITKRLQGFSPEVEASTDFTGIFWLNVAGLLPLYPSFERWAQATRGGLRELGFHTTVVVGFSRFATYAVARSSRAITVFQDSYQEHEATLRIPLERLDLDGSLRVTLAKLGVGTVGTFLRLPAAGLRERFGNRAYDLHRLANGNQWAPITPRPPEEPVEQRILLDEAIVNVVHLLAVVRRLLVPMLQDLAHKQKALTTLHVLFALDTRDNHIESVRPAAPTLDVAILLDLLQLRLHAGQLPAGVIEIQLRGEVTEAAREQLRLFAATTGRDLRAGARALARLRAELGESSVVRAQLREGHLPEAGYGWEACGSLAELPRAHPRRVAVRTLVRRIYTRPRPLPPRPSTERNDNWLMHGLEFGPVVRLLGPYIVSGGWWTSTTHREYHFIETRRGDLLWTYYDRKRRRWYLQGKIE